MKSWRLTFLTPCELSDVEDYLLEKGFTLSFISQAVDGTCEAFATMDESGLQEALKESSYLKNLQIEEMLLPEVCWQTQAELHSPHFKNGKIEIKTQNHAASFFLQPAHAFGDASHETTKLMLLLLARHVKNQYVLDIGTGSAILAICAYLEGAIKSYGVDIDQEALKAAKANVMENRLEKHVWIGDKKNLRLSKKTYDALVILANMISSELLVILDEYKEYFERAHLAILSGILVSEKNEIIENFQKLGWNLLEEEFLGEWVGLVFIR